jgi:hypothetical protein
MDTRYIYLIIGLVLAVIALVAIFRYPKIKMFLQALGMRLSINGETGSGAGRGTESKAGPEPEQPPREQQPSSATTRIGGRVSGSTVITSASGGKAETTVGEDVKDSSIKTES